MREHVKKLSTFFFKVDMENKEKILNSSSHHKDGEDIVPSLAVVGSNVTIERELNLTF